jgi:DNA-binding CsgD family transcriptional regulator/PAS domain-containing protein
MTILAATAFSQLVGMIYAAAADPQQWPLFLNQFASLMHSGGTILFMHDFADSRFVADGVPGVVAEAAGFEPVFVESYATHYSSKNVWTALEESMLPGTAVVSEMLLPERELVRTEFFADWLHPQNLRHAIGGVVLKSGTQAMKFTSLRSSRHGAYGQDELAFYAALMPHLQQACKINQQFAQLRKINTAQTSALDALPMAVWLCKHDASMLICNRAAKAIVDGQRGLQLDSIGRLRAEHIGENDSLQSAFRRAGSASALTRTRLHKRACTSDHFTPRVGSTLQIRRLCSQSHLAVTVSPLSSDGETGGFFHQEADIIVFATDPDHSSAPMEMLQSAYGLTKHQARLATALINGSDLKSYAVKHGIGYETARTHLKQVLSKTGASKQSELIRLFLYCAGGQR